MKKILYILFLLPVFCRGQSLAHLDEKNGFGGVVLGDTITKLATYSNVILPKPGTAVIDKISLTSYYLEDIQQLKITDDITLDNFVIRYFDNRVYNIYLYFDYSQSMLIEQVLRKAYGPPQIEGNGLFWNAKKVSLLWLWDDSKTQYIIFTCKPLQPLYDAKRQEYLKSQTTKF